MPWVAGILVIISDLIRTGRFDAPMQELIRDGLDDEQIAWRLTDQFGDLLLQLVQRIQFVFCRGNARRQTLNFISTRCRRAVFQGGKSRAVF